MSLLANLSTSNEIANEKDSVGSSGPLASGLYLCTVAMAYLSKSAKGALALNLTLKTDSGREIRQQLWMTSGQDKGCVNFYVDKEGNKQYLPGFNLANSLCLLTARKEISQLDTEQKVVSIYNFDAKAEVPTKVDVIMDLLNQEVLVGLIKQKVDKNVKNDAGQYVASGETREENEIDKFFRASDKKTTAEIRAQAEEATFFQTWETKWKDQVRDKSSASKGNVVGTIGAPRANAPAANAGTNKPTASLFG